MFTKPVTIRTSRGTKVLLVFVAAFMFAPPLHAQNRSDEPPVAGRPKRFSQVVGNYQIDQFSAQPTEVVVEDPITVTILISGKGPAKYQPKRALLRLFDDEIEHDFYVEPVPEQDRVYHWRHGAGWRTWRFVYRFRPKSTSVTEIPKPKLSYYLPRNGYATALGGQAIRLTVKPRPELTPRDVGLSLQAPDRLYHVVRGAAVLVRDDSRPYMTAPVLLAVGLGAPAVSWLGFVLWQWLLPDRLRRLQRRRSQSARRALRELGHARKACSADVLAGILTAYLSERLDFPAVEPTPVEVARFLRRRGVAPATRQQWAELFRSFDEMRYTPSLRPLTDTAPGDAWPTRAANLIQALEADPCLACGH